MLRHLGLLAIVATQPALAAKGAADKPPAPSTIVIAHDQCVLTDVDSGPKSNFFGALAALIVPALVKISVDAAVGELTKVRTVKASGQTEGYLYSRADGTRTLDNNMPSCMTMVTGAFKGSYADAKVRTGAANRTLLPPKAPSSEILTRVGNHILLEPEDASATLYSVLEVKLSESDDKTAFRYQPVYLRVFELMPGNSGKSQGLVYTISINGAGATPNGTTFAAAPISFGSVSADFEVTSVAKNPEGKLGQSPELERKLEKFKTGWLALPGLSDTARSAYLQHLRTGASGPSKYMPFVIKAEIVQTQKPSDAAKFVAKLLGGIKDGAAAKAGELVAPNREFTQSQAKLTAEAAVYDAQAALAAAMAESPQNPAKIKAAEIKLEIARNALNELG